MVAELFDSHAHLGFRDYAEDLDEVLERARAAGVRGIVTVGSGGGARAYREAVAVAGGRDWIWPTVGLHPHEARHGSAALLSEIAEAADAEEVVAIGETGLDYHYDRSPRGDQRRVFGAQLDLALALDKPVVIHTREADDDTLAILGERRGEGLSGVVHCFSGGPAFAERVLDLGLHVSFSGIVTFPKAVEVQEAARAVPDAALLVETDSPFLSPPPRRGRRNEPAGVRPVAEKVAELRGVSLEDVARITALNARRLFRLPGGEDAPIAYAIRDQLYLNVTNRCTLSCVFCPKRRDWTVKGHVLRHDREPAEAEVRAALEAARPDEHREVVFCGLGEPTRRLGLVLTLARELKARGIKTRLDTDGLASLREGRDVAAEIGAVFDAVSVSLNAPDGRTYAELCPSPHGEAAWAAAVSFLRRCREEVPEVTASVVAVPGLDVEACRRLVEDEIGVGFRARDYNVVG